MGKQWKQWQTLFSWAPKSLQMVTAAMKLKDLLFGRKAMTNLDSILKSRDITLLTKVHIVKTVVFLVVMYGCESWTIKKAEHGRIDAFELWCWRRFLRVPWIARTSNQSILKEINSEYSLEGLMLKLNSNTLAIWHTGKDPDSGKNWRQKENGGGRGWDGWIVSQIQFSKLWERVEDRGAWRSAVHWDGGVRHELVTQ